VKHKIPTERSFGYTFAGVFTLLAGWLFWRGRPGGIEALAAAIAFGALALLAPRVLRPLNVAWGWVGLALNTVVSPVVMGVIFFGIFSPVALVLRLTGRDELRRKTEPSRPSYWIDRTPPGPPPASFPRQF
jgi:hypothetical protein